MYVYNIPNFHAKNMCPASIEIVKLRKKNINIKEN